MASSKKTKTKKVAKAAKKTTKATKKATVKVAKKAATKATKKAPAKSSALLAKPKKDGKAYTKTQLIAHLAEAVTRKTGGEISKKQASAFVDAYTELALSYAPVGSLIPGLGKVVVRKTPARPKRKGRNPATGEEITIPAKRAGQKLVFRFAKPAKDLHNK